MSDATNAPDRAWHTAIDLLCRGCGYDVTRTIADGFSRCPECGDDVSREICLTRKRTLRAGVRAALAVLWMSPLITVPLLTAWIDAFSWRADPLGVMLSLCVAMLGLCFVGWVYVERWALPAGAIERAMLRTVAVFGIHVGSLITVFISVYLISMHVRG